MKKTISLAAIAVAVATSSSALIFFPSQLESKTYCLEISDDAFGALLADSCDETENNQKLRREIRSNGCAAGQIALTTSKSPEEENFPIQIESCFVPNFTQL